MQLMKKVAFAMLVGKIVEGQATLTADVQEAAINAIGHANAYGDVTFGQNLLSAMGKSVRASSLLAYLEQHGNFAWMKSDKKLVHFKNPNAVNFADEVALAKLKATPWNGAKAEPELKSQYDVDDMFTKFLTSTRKAIAKAQEAGIKVKNLDLLEALSSTATHFDEVREERAKRTARISETVLARVEFEMDWEDAIQMNIGWDDEKAAIKRERINSKTDDANATDRGVKIDPIKLAA